MYSSVHHFTGGLFTVLRHPACVVLWYLPSRHEVANNRCSLAKTSVAARLYGGSLQYTLRTLVIVLAWIETNFRLFTRLGFKGFITFSDLRLLGYKELKRSERESKTRFHPRLTVIFFCFINTRFVGLFSWSFLRTELAFPFWRWLSFQVCSLCPWWEWQTFWAD